MLGICVVASVTKASYAMGPVYSSVAGLWLSPSNHLPKLYGPTSAMANWSIEQWDIPQDLPIFDKSGVSQNNWAKVAWLGNGRYELSQDAATLQCEKTFPSGKHLADEFDLFVAPNNQRVSRFPQAGLDNRESISNLRSIRARISLEVMEARTAGQHCPVDTSVMMYAVVLRDFKMRQVFFYQLRLGYFRGIQTIVRTDAPAPEWFFTGNNTQSGQVGTWGFGDNITVYSQPWASVGKEQSYSVDLLPHLNMLIRQGARYGLDQNLEDWQLTGTYHGQAATGHVVNRALWSEFALVAQ